MDCIHEALSPAQQQDMDFARALDMLIAASITCLRNRDYRLKRAIEIAINYRSLSPAPVASNTISLEELDELQEWLAPCGATASNADKSK
jgi:hypothetical protein